MSARSSVLHSFYTMKSNLGSLYQGFRECHLFPSIPTNNSLFHSILLPLHPQYQENESHQLEIANEFQYTFMNDIHSSHFFPQNLSSSNPLLTLGMSVLFKTNILVIQNNQNQIQLYPQLPILFDEKRPTIILFYDSKYFSPIHRNQEFLFPPKDNLIRQLIFHHLLQRQHPVAFLQLTTPVNTLLQTHRQFPYSKPSLCDTPMVITNVTLQGGIPCQVIQCERKRSKSTKKRITQYDLNT